MQQVPLFLQPLVKYVDFKGRARRSEFWLWTLAQVVLFIVLDTVLMSTLPAMTASSDPSKFASHFMGFSAVVNLISLALFLPSLAVQVRRLHDSNRTGWWIVMPLGVFILGVTLFLITNMGKFMSLMNNHTGNTDPSAVFAVIGSAMLFIWLPIIIASIVMLVFFCLDGTVGSNRFGPDPKGRGGDVNVF
ncbi:DUF805 domain-containing protein [Asticcacaulis solisilvae]|uniref:DUF805 domain-containing protein n=1 Tax=Asticcacaulis solisilvae TaxID=1217274 RepID=UPI003FD6C6BB